MMGLKPILVDGLQGRFHCVGRSLGRRLAPSSPRARQRPGPATFSALTSGGIARWIWNGASHVSWPQMLWSARIAPLQQ